MKNVRFLQIFLLTLLSVSLSLTKSNSQFLEYQEFEILPQEPNNLEVTELRILTKFYTGNQGLQAYDIQFNENNIWVSLCYVVLNIHIQTQAEDTLMLGQLGSGGYNLMIATALMGECDSMDFSHFDTLNFQVAPGTYTTIQNENEGITLQPNPFKDHFTLHLSSDAMFHPVSLRLYDYSGREVLFREMESGTAHRVSTEHLPPGVYMYRLELENGQDVSGKVVKY